MLPLFDADTRIVGTPLPFWRACVEHPNRDDYWKARDPRPHFRNIRPAVMTVGGLYDAEDLYGTLGTFPCDRKTEPEHAKYIGARSMETREVSIERTVIPG